MHIGSQIKKEFARALRKEQTQTEEIIWEKLRNRRFNRLKFRRQHVIEGFVLDFYCHEIKLGIEIDGTIHDQRFQKEYDTLRQEIIEMQGIIIVRITNEEVLTNQNNIYKKFEAELLKYPLSH